MTRLRTSLFDVRAAVSLAAVGLLALAGGGCNIAGPIFYAIHGPAKVEREYRLEGKRPTVVLVDDMSSRVAQRRFRAIIGETAQQALLDRGVISEGYMIDTRSAMASSLQGTADDPISITEIGESVGAEVVVYAVVTRFDLVTEGRELSPGASMNVQVVDVQSRTVLWPPGVAEGYPLNLQMPDSARDRVTSKSAAVQSQVELAQFAGIGLSQLFYSVEAPQSVRR